jgi:hypothetical protein
MAFLIAFARWATVGEDKSILTRYKYTPKTSRIGTSLSGPAILLKFLKIIYKIIFLSIPGSSI